MHDRSVLTESKMPSSTKLTKRLVEQLSPRQETYIAWDSELRGFGCRVHPGGKRTFVLKYRVKGGRGATQRKLTLGTYGSVTVEEARQMARQALAEVIQGGDPAGRLHDYRRAHTFEQYAERYMADHAWPRKAKRSAEEDQWMLDKYILAMLGKRKTVDLSTPDFARLLNSLSRKPSLANRVRALLSKMMSLALV
jgi:hypothetical protein